MKYLKTKATKLFKLVVEWELFRNMLSYIARNLLIPHWVRQYAFLCYSLLPLQSSAAYLKLRCFLSNQPRSVLSFFKMNRIRFKHSTSKGALAGIKKSSW